MITSIVDNPGIMVGVPILIAFLRPGLGVLWVEVAHFCSGERREDNRTGQ